MILRALCIGIYSAIIASKEFVNARAMWSERENFYRILVERSSIGVCNEKVF